MRPIAVVAVLLLAVPACKLDERRLWDRSQVCDGAFHELISFEVDRGLWLFCREAFGSNRERLVLEFIDRETLLLSPVARAPIPHVLCHDVVGAAAHSDSLALVCKGDDGLTAAVADTDGTWRVPPTRIRGTGVLGMGWRDHAEVAVRDGEMFGHTTHIIEIRGESVVERTVAGLSPCSNVVGTWREQCLLWGASLGADHRWRFLTFDGLAADETGTMRETAIEWRGADQTTFGVPLPALNAGLIVTPGLGIAERQLLGPAYRTELMRWIQVGLDRAPRSQPCWEGEGYWTCVIGGRTVDWPRDFAKVFQWRAATRGFTNESSAESEPPASWMTIRSGGTLFVWRDGRQLVVDDDGHPINLQVRRAASK